MYTMKFHETGDLILFALFVLAQGSELAMDSCSDRWDFPPQGKSQCEMGCGCAASE